MPLFPALWLTSCSSADAALHAAAWRSFTRLQAPHFFGTLVARKCALVGKPLNILSVDDEFRVAHALAFTLSNPARKLTLAFSAGEALTKVSSNHCEPFDVVIVDHKMPQVSGIEFVQRLRDVQFGGKIIVLSAHLTDDNRRAYTELKVDTMLTKPFDVHELRDLVDSLANVT